MRKSLTLKTLLRSPLKTLLTFLIIAAASFALFSRVTDYAVTSRETANAESFYHGVVALDNSVPLMMIQREGGYVSGVQPTGKPWPEDEQLEGLTSLPGVTLADTRYMTAGRIEDYKRLISEYYAGENMGSFVLEGTYVGYKDAKEGGDEIELAFDDVAVLAGEVEPVAGEPIIISHDAIEKIEDEENPYPREFFDSLKAGSRCLVIGRYSETDKSSLTTDNSLNRSSFFDEKSFRILDGLGGDYLDTEPFAFYKKWIEAVNRNLYTYDIVYTSDMRAIPRFNEHSMVISEGRILTGEDTGGCVVSKLFLETYGLSVGDKVHVEFGNKLFSQNPVRGAQTRGAEEMSEFVADAELEIVGVYRDVDDADTRLAEYGWAYSPSTVFVPESFLPVEVPDDYEVSMGEYSVFVEDAHDIEAFQEAAEPLVAKMGLDMRFSDGGWLSMKDSFETGKLTSFLTAVLYVLGAVLALLLASYLYIGRNKESYAIMRAMGVPVKKAGGSLVFPFALLLSLAMPIGGAAGLFHTSKEAAGAFAALVENAPEGYVPDVSMPIIIVVLCLFFELAVTLCFILFFLRRMKKISPLELLQGGALRVGMDNKEMLRAGMDKKPLPDIAGNVAVSGDAGFSKETLVQSLSSMETPADAYSPAPQGRKYGALRQVTSFTLRHMRRSIGKTSVSLLLTAALAAGVGTFVLARLTYHDAFYKVDVKVSASEFASSAVDDMSRSDLAEDFYCYNVFNVRVNGLGLNTPMVLTNDLDRYLTENYTSSYMGGYDISDLESDKALCMVGEGLAQTLGVDKGDEIALLSDPLYSVLKEVYEDEEKLQEISERKAVTYKVIGIVKSDGARANTGIYTGINGPAQDVYGQPFPFGYCGFILSDNGKLDELEQFLTALKDTDAMYAPKASFYIDSEALHNVARIRTLLESLFPIAVAAAVFIGMVGYLLVILQSAKEAAFLRILGVTKKRARCMLTLEQVLLCVIGIILVAGGFALYSPGLFARSTETLAACYALYFLGCLSGAAAAAVHVTRGRILELLQVKE